MLPSRLRLTSIAMLAFAVLALAGCATTSPTPPPEQAAPVTPTLPPGFPPQQLVGRWGLAAYHVESDRQRTEAAALRACQQPYVISMGGNGGVMMHLADQATPTELRVKGAPGGKNYIGPADEPPGSAQDRLVEQFDGRVLILRWIDSEVQGRYGTMVYVRCTPDGSKRPRKTPSHAKPASKPKPKAA
jgi:hypothetical protein